MKYDKFRRSGNVEDYRDPARPVTSASSEAVLSINEMLTLVNSSMARDAGRDDIKDAADNRG